MWPFSTMVTAMPGTPTWLRISSTRASKLAGGSASAAPVAHQARTAMAPAVNFLRMGLPSLALLVCERRWAGEPPGADDKKRRDEERDDGDRERAIALGDQVDEADEVG